jgi:RNA polymerase subunit RPABC4/transcription elongation factor Spt4
LIELMQQELVDGQQSSAAPNTNLRLWGCVDCGRLISKKAAACPNCGRAFGSEQTQDEEIRYPALFAIAALYRVFAVVTAIACLIGGLFLAGSNIPGKEQAIVSLAGYLVLLPTGLWATAGLIVLLIDIEKNTRGKGR